MADPNAFQRIKAVTESKYGPEYITELEERRRVTIGDLTPQAMEDAANAVLLRHSAEILQGLAVVEGRGVDTGALPPSYVNTLNAKGVTQDQAVEAIARMHPRLNRAAALKKWQQAAKAVDYDIHEGDANPSTFYDPNATAPRESNG